MIHQTVKIGERTAVGQYVQIDEGVSIGDDCYIGNFVHIRRGASIGDHSQIRDFSFVEIDTKIGNYVQIRYKCQIAPRTLIEDRVTIAPGCCMAETKRQKWQRDMEPDVRFITIRKGARIGVGAILLPGVEIGQECMIGGGAVVTKPTEPFWVYVGNPARKLKPVPKEEYIQW